jgi:hypothetical protein
MDSPVRGPLRLEPGGRCELPLGSFLRYSLNMKRSIEAIPKKRGRPATGKDPLVAVRLPKAMIAALDARSKVDGVTRSETMRRLLEGGLKRRPKA